MAVGLALGIGALAPGAVVGADGPLLQGSPWPEMRHDMHNTAQSPIRATYRGDRPWSFKTQRGNFSTPVIGADVGGPVDLE